MRGSAENKCRAVGARRKRKAGKRWRQRGPGVRLHDRPINAVRRRRKKTREPTLVEQVTTNGRLASAERGDGQRGNETGRPGRRSSTIQQAGRHAARTPKSKRREVSLVEREGRQAYDHGVERSRKRPASEKSNCKSR